MREAVVVASSRTPLAKSHRGSFNITRPDDLAAHCIKDVLGKAPQLDPKEVEKKIAELDVVEHWLKANVSMLQLSRQSLQYQLAMLKGGEKFQEEIASQGKKAKAAPGDAANPATWAWNMMAEAGKSAAAPAPKEGEPPVKAKKPPSARKR